MQDGFATEGLRRQEEYKNLEEKMSAKMAEGFKNEENARKLVQNELAVMKDDIKDLKMSGGSTVGSGPGTVVGSGIFARPPPLASRWNRSKKDGVQKVGLPTTQKSSIQGITDDEVLILVRDLERMVPRQAHKSIYWANQERTRDLADQGDGQYVVQNETNLGTMIELLKGVKEELEKEAYKIHGQNVKARQEVSPRRMPLTKAQALFSNGLKEHERR